MPLNLNKVTVAGRVSWKGDLKEIPNGKTIINFQVAVSEFAGKDKEPATEFISCIAWERNAEFFNKYFDKGTPIYLEGRLKSTEYDKQGVKVRQTNVYANDIKFSEDKPKSERQSQQSKAPAYVPQSYAEPEAPAPQIDTAFEPELPF